MILLYPLALAAAGAIAWRSRADARVRGWVGFFAWTVAGLVFTFSLLTGFSIGLFVFPFAVAVLFFVAARAPGLRESIGFVEGVGAMLLVVAFRNRDYEPCPPGGLSIPPGAPPGTSVSCGGSDPAPWLAWGLTLCALALVAFLALGVVARLGRVQPS